jgi:2-keto-4-pentenoate hydratase/2-oxohepta-3-ene-1,7-dioic acid hydratase in catechol pathway
MNFVRFRLKDKILYGVLEDGTVQPIQGSIYADYSLLPVKYSLNDIKLLAPCEPSKILCVGLNYRDHAEEMNLQIPKWPVIFMKPSTSVIGPEEEIVYPNSFVKRLDYEAELAVVIKEKTKNIETEMVEEYILGYTCANDVTARNMQPKDGQWTVSKSFDTFLPLGPWIVSWISPGGHSITCTVNGVTKQSSNTRNLIFDVPYLVSYLSKIMTLLPGDVIITGTPSGVSPISPGDEVTVAIEGIGTLTNRVVKRGGVSCQSM